MDYFTLTYLARERAESYRQADKHVEPWRSPLGKRLSFKVRLANGLRALAERLEPSPKAKHLA